MANLKAYRDYSEHDVTNGLFKLNTATGSKGTPVVINGSGWNSSLNLTVAQNLAAGLNGGNSTSTRWQVPAEVRAAVSGEKPFGITLFDTLETGPFGTPFMWDKQRRIEKQVLISGEAQPIVHKGLFLVGPFQTGETPGVGKFLVVRATGEYGVATGSTVPATAFGRFLGPKDSDGYALAHINCYL